MKASTKLAILLTPVVLIAASAQGALIAEYDMTDGDLLNDSSGNGNTLTEFDTSQAAGDGGISLNANGYATFTGAGYLLVDRNNTLETGTFTVSYWWRSSDLSAEANFEGPSFSTMSNSTQEWQITSLGTNLQVRDASALVTSPKSNYLDGVWYNTVIQSSGGNTFDLWISEEGGTLTQVGSNIATTNGGLVIEDFIFGTNRAKNAFGTFDLANVKIFDDATVTASSLLAEGSQAIPEPSSYALMAAGVALALIGLRRRSA